MSVDFLGSKPCNIELGKLCYQQNLHGTVLKYEIASKVF